MVYEGFAYLGLAPGLSAVATLVPPLGPALLAQGLVRTFKLKLKKLEGLSVQIAWMLTFQCDIHSFFVGNFYY